MHTTADWIEAFGIFLVGAIGFAWKVFLAITIIHFVVKFW